MIRHVLLARFRSAEDAQRAQDRRDALDAMESLRSLPTVQQFVLGVDRGLSDAAWDLALMVDVASRDDLDVYLGDPVHQHVVEVTGPLFSEIASVDIEPS